MATDVNKIFEEVHKGFKDNDRDVSNPLDEVNRQIEEGKDGPNKHIFQKDPFKGTYDN